MCLLFLNASSCSLQHLPGGTGTAGRQDSEYGGYMHVHVFKYIKSSHQKCQEGWERPSSLLCKRSVKKILQSPHRKILPSSTVSEVDFTFKARIQILCLIYIYRHVYTCLIYIYRHVGAWVHITHTHYVCFLCTLRVLYMDFLLSLPESWQDTWEPLHWPQQTLLRHLKKQQGGQSELQLHWFQWLPGRQTRNFFLFPECRAFWTFRGSLWTSIKRDLFNVWVCLRRGSQINQANVEFTCFQHLYK